MKVKAIIASLALFMTGVAGSGILSSYAEAAPLALRKLPPQLGPNARTLYHEVFADIHQHRYAAAINALSAMPEGPLHNVARAEIILAKGSPKATLDSILALLASAPELPEGAALEHLATLRGATSLPALPPEQDMAWLGAAPHRGHTEAAEDAARSGVAGTIIGDIKNDQPALAESYLDTNSSALNSDTLTEMRQRIAWSYFLTGNDSAARALAAKAHDGTGEWAAQSDWIAGLAAWRQHDYRGAASNFISTAQRAHNAELVAAGYFWAARAALNAQAPHAVAEYLRAAASKSETFYGLLAQGQLGERFTPVDDPTLARIPGVEALPNVRAALALAEI
ncbi:MAG: lytic transglycosylase domain-containing protein, partial [Alphaproteobacteria bacterium]|nr:lytic transglycosylase domain-containing protein [Alphaproteobacteria bacterium]